MENQSVLPPTFGPHVMDPTERIVHKINIKNAIKAVTNLSRRETVAYKWARRKSCHETAYNRAVFGVKKEDKA